VETCTEKGCPAGLVLTVTVGSETNFDLTTTAAVDHGGSVSFPCGDVDPGYAGTITASCALGALGAPDTTTCAAAPCETFQGVEHTLAGVVGLAAPVAAIAPGGTGDGVCSSVNPNYSGVLELACSAQAVLTVTSDTGCKAACLQDDTASATIDGTAVTVGPGAPTFRIESGGTKTEPCNGARPGFIGDITLSCLEGTTTADVTACQPEGCPEGTSLTNPLVTGEDPPLWAPTLGAGGLVHAATLDTDCSLAHGQWSGTLTLTCSYGGLTADVTGCTVAEFTPSDVTFACGIGQPCSITLGGSGFAGSITLKIVEGPTCSSTPLPWVSTPVAPADPTSYYAPYVFDFGTVGVSSKVGAVVVCDQGNSVVSASDGVVIGGAAANGLVYDCTLNEECTVLVNGFDLQDTDGIRLVAGTCGAADAALVPNVVGFPVGLGDFAEENKNASMAVTITAGPSSLQYRLCYGRGAAAATEVASFPVDLGRFMLKSGNAVTNPYSLTLPVGLLDLSDFDAGGLSQLATSFMTAVSARALPVTFPLLAISRADPAVPDVQLSLEVQAEDAAIFTDSAGGASVGTVFGSVLHASARQALSAGQNQLDT